MQQAENQSQDILIPLHNMVIVEPEPVKDTTEAGVDIPDSVKERPSRGIIIAAGPGIVGEDQKVLIPTQVRPGDTVLYQKHGGTEIQEQGKDYLLMKESNIMAIVGRHERNMPPVESGEGIQYLLDNAPKPLFTIVLEKAVSAPSGHADFFPASIYQQKDGEVSNINKGGVLKCQRTGIEYIVDGLGLTTSEGNPWRNLNISTLEGGAIDLLAGDKLDYYPLAEEKEEENI